jgi:hypothetical protein
MALPNGSNATLPVVNTLVTGKEYLEVQDPSPAMSKLSVSSQAIHADDYLNSGQDVAPPIHVSTTYRYSSNPDKLLPWDEYDVGVLPLWGIPKLTTGQA